MLKIFELMKNGTVEDVKKCCYLLGVNDLTCEECQYVLNEITKYVFDMREQPSGERTFDLNLDYKYYFVDFLRLGINLNKQDISWWEFDSILEAIFLDDKSTLSKIMSYRLYEKPSKNIKQQEAEEHKFRMKMKRKYALPLQVDSEKALEKLWGYVEKKAGENKE